MKYNIESRKYRDIEMRLGPMASTSDLNSAQQPAGGVVATAPLSEAHKQATTTTLLSTLMQRRIRGALARRCYARLYAAVRMQARARGATV